MFQTNLMTKEPSICYTELPSKLLLNQRRCKLYSSLLYASAKESNNHPSLNDCLLTGKALQPLLQDILIRYFLKSVASLGDVKQAFLQIGVNKEDRDALR